MLPALVLLAALLTGAVLAAAAQIRCVDAAGVGARALARGESQAEVERVVSELAPRGAVVRLGRAGDLVLVEVRARVRLPWRWGGAGPGIQVRDRAVAAVEPGTTWSAGGPPGSAAPPAPVVPAPGRLVDEGLP